MEACTAVEDVMNSHDCRCRVNHALPSDIELKSLAKVELHLHLGGAWPLSYIRSICDESQYIELCRRLESAQGEGSDYHTIFDVFPLISNIVNTDNKVEDGIVALCAELTKDNVMVVEFRTGLKDLGHGYLANYEAVMRGVRRGIECSRIKAGVVLSVRRDSPLSYVQTTVQLAMASYLSTDDVKVIGLDVSGDSTKGDIRNILEPLKKAREIGLPFTLHIGESNEENEDNQMLELQVLTPSRVGHAVHLKPRTKEWVYGHRIPIELCVSSSVIAGMVTYAHQHPVLELMKIDSDFPVFVCTDDPLVFSVDLSHELKTVASLVPCSIERLREMQLKALDVSFLTVKRE